MVCGIRPRPTESFTSASSPSNLRATLPCPPPFPFPFLLRSLLAFSSSPPLPLSLRSPPTPFRRLSLSPPYSIPEAPRGFGRREGSAQREPPERARKDAASEDQRGRGKAGGTEGGRGREGQGAGREGGEEGGRGELRDCGARAGSCLSARDTHCLGHRFAVSPFCFSLPSPPGWRGLTRPRREGRVARRAT